MRISDKSLRSFEAAKQVMPGGVNSPVRAFRSVGTHPIFIERGLGARVTDIDKNIYIDYLCSWGPLILGHAHPLVVEKIREVAERGTSFGLPTLLETELAELIIERMPSVEMVRMVNSGTEATMSALRLARAYTKRDKVLKFAGGYHGHSDSFLIQAGSGIATLGLPDSPGVLAETALQTITIPYNDLDQISIAFDRYGEQIAAVIVEPVAGNMGCVPPVGGFLESLRKVTEEYGAILIFDEVMTGFRVGYYSAQGKYNVMPDLTTMGKVIGGGLPVGAYGGKQELMQLIAPEGPVYQAGTLSGNPLAMAAGIATLNEMTPEAYDRLELIAFKLENGIRENLSELGVPNYISRVGSMISLFFSNTNVTNYEEAKCCNSKMFTTYFKEMMAQGIMLPPSQFEAMFVSTAHSEADIECTIEANRQALKVL